MKLRRLLALSVLAAGVAGLVVLDAGARPRPLLDAATRGAVPVVDEDTTWFCPGATSGDGPAVVGLEVAATASDEVAGRVRILDDTGAVPEPIDEVAVPAGGRQAVPIADRSTGTWVAGIVETGPGRALVTQTVAGEAGVEAATCPTTSGDQWVLPHGATRSALEGERLTLVLTNPFPDDAVLDVDLVSAFGTDTLPALVVPAGRVVAVDLTDEVPEAADVTAIVRVTAGRLVAGRVQIVDSATERGLVAGPLVATTATVWAVPDARWLDGRRDRLAVTNPSPSEVAEVDVEVLPDDPDAIAEPFELSIRPGRTVVLDLAAEKRLVDAGPGALVVRALGDAGVAVQLDAVRALDAGGGLAGGGVADLASRRWSLVVPGGQSTATLTVFNPSADAVAPVRVRAGDRVVSSFELGPGRRSTVDLVEVGFEGGVLTVDADSRVVAVWAAAGPSSLLGGVGGAERSSALPVAELP